MLKQFEAAANDPRLHDRLTEALANPRGKVADEVMAPFLPILCTCHAAVPFSTSERYAVMGKMNAMIAFFGMPSIFYKVAP